MTQLTKINQLTLPMNKPILPDLTTLSLFAKDQAVVDLSWFSSQTAINLHNVTRLRLVRFGTNTSQHSSNSFKKLLSFFPNISDLGAFNVFYHTQAGQQRLNFYSLFPNLARVCWVGSISWSVIGEFRIFS